MESKLKVGDTVKLDEAWGKPIGGKTGFVKAIKEAKSQSGFMVLTSIYKNYLDSAWLTKIEDPWEEI